MILPTKRLKGMILSAVLPAVAACSTGLQVETKTGSGSASAQSLSSKGEQDAAKNSGAASAANTNVNKVETNKTNANQNTQASESDLATTPFITPVNSNANGLPTHNTGGTQANEAGVGGIPIGTPGEAEFVGETGPMPIGLPPQPIGDKQNALVRWTDTGDLSTLRIDCLNTESYGGNVWQTDCMVVTPTGMGLDLTFETSGRAWTLKLATGCSPQKFEDAVPGAPTHFQLLYTGSAIGTCVSKTTVQLKATTQKGQVLTLSTVLTL